MRHKLTPPLCKGRGTTSVVEGLSKSLCKAPEAAVQRRCGDCVSGGKVVKKRHKHNNIEIYTNRFKSERRELF